MGRWNGFQIERLDEEQGKLEFVKGIEDAEEIRLVLDRPHEGGLGQLPGLFLVNDPKAPEAVFPPCGQASGNPHPVNGRRWPGGGIFSLGKLAHTYAT